MPMPISWWIAVVPLRMIMTGQDAAGHPRTSLTNPSVIEPRSPASRFPEDEHQRVGSASGDRLRRRVGIDLQARGQLGRPGGCRGEGPVALFVDQIGDDVGGLAGPGAQAAGEAATRRRQRPQRSTGSVASLVVIASDHPQ